jgi:hypothetical protein
LIVQGWILYNYTVWSSVQISAWFQIYHNIDLTIELYTSVHNCDKLTPTVQHTLYYSTVHWSCFFFFNVTISGVQFKQWVPNSIWKLAMTNSLLVHWCTYRMAPTVMIAWWLDNLATVPCTLNILYIVLIYIRCFYLLVGLEYKSNFYS